MNGPDEEAFLALPIESVRRMYWWAVQYGANMRHENEQLKRQLGMIDYGMEDAIRDLEIKGAQDGGT